MMANKSAHFEVADQGRAERMRISQLLSRYPRVSDTDTAEIITFLRKGPHYDVGMLTGDEAIRPQLDAFMSDHKKHFTLKPWEGAATVAAIIGALLVFWLLWEGWH